MNEQEIQEKSRKFWENTRSINQTRLIDHLLKNQVEGFETDNIENLYTEEDEFREILEWWEVTGWLAARLRMKGEPILSNDCGHWWGRCTSGQSVYMDSVIEDLALGK